MAVAARRPSGVALVAFTSTMGMVGIHMRNPRAIVAADRPNVTAVRNIVERMLYYYNNVLCVVLCVLSVCVIDLLGQWW